MNGVFAVKKPVGPSSQDCVGKLKRLFTNSSHFERDQTKKRKNQFIKIGHGGTLDPLADGVLVIGVGSGTKQLQKFLEGCKKQYVATCLFGSATTTYDSEGSVLGYSNVEGLTDEKIQKALEKFRGTIKQVPPVFSAIKMDGMPLYEYARKGLKLPRAIEQRECTISHLHASPLRWEHEHKAPEQVASEAEQQFAKDVMGRDLSGGTVPEKSPCIDISFEVSSGTYIRSLVHDLALELGVQGHMVKLTRTVQADWELETNCLPLEYFDKPNEEWWPLLSEVLAKGSKRVVTDDLNL